MLYFNGTQHIFQISYESEAARLTICDSQLNEFLDICRGKKLYKKGQVFELKAQGKHELNVDVVPYFYSGGILVSERLYLALYEPLCGSGQWIECIYLKKSIFILTLQLLSTRLITKQVVVII
ncbi:hypothetical protein S4054249_21160 [Pseudoalteromonas luteoviolacea]|uniref:Uncharacterized protein n=1 Tax=Pseudoalteromonas luteoviolacea S4054 TaxID=1129367 RepID=A0A0F6A418_9GAMM|nr:hypothetical protein S4054249_21160 [Pseudoalteromonas luteoviolacea]AOT15545.1 hypothetical protein S40542_22430 [Pseudoalteromonas luteoviolacea]AOT20204.1 hypothetical protein S4054_21075 [Pseudoalteromonas luteoviolacea]KKE80957.1 hypothetical protein N479_24160 [Pseudoalteromonas luteoviolacea S4054]KZN64678.1 hypothetical protein N481_25325 [Pseudoalteromonas luteoviolacea S4047-1]